jgi:dynein heavy chain
VIKCVYISGLFIEWEDWDPEKGQLFDPRPKELFQEIPPILLILISNRKSHGTGIYVC